MTCALCGADDADKEGGLCPACDRLSSFFTKTLGKDRAPTGELTEAEAKAPPASTFAPGQSFGDRYTVVELVGAGGMGQVYKVIDRRLDRTVALKLIRRGLQAQIGALQRFRRELTLAQQVTHPNVCRVHDLGEVAGDYYITMEFVSGQTLEDLIHSMGHLSARQTITIARQVCAGLGAIHAQAIVHRDLKPGNVMVDRSGHAVVMDFGMAYHPGDDRLTSEGSVLGTLAYLSPEHARGQTTDVRSDIYALGVIFYEMLTGRRPPGDGGPLPLALREATERCPPPSHFLPEVPADLDAIVMRCLQRDPGARFANTAELDQALGHAAAALSTTLMPAAPATGIVPLMAATRARQWMVSGVAALVLAGILTWLLRTTPPPPKTTPRSVALLPLAYEGSPDSSWLKELSPMAAGDQLRRLGRVEVTPFAISRTFGTSEEPKEIAKQLSVEAVVRGRIRVHDQRAEMDIAIWRKDGREVKPIHREAPEQGVLAEAEPLARAILLALDGTPSALPAPPHNAQALEAYFKGQSFLEGWDVERNDEKAQASFEEAIREDDKFAEAHAGLATALWRRYRRTGDAPLVERALGSAQRAVALAPNLPEARIALGIVLLARGRSAEAGAAFAEARKLAPADDTACRQMARAYEGLQRYDEAEKAYQEAIDLRPSYWENYNNKASFYLRTGKHREAKELFGKVIELRPLSIAAYNNKAAVHMLDGEFKQAEPLLRAALQLGPSTQAQTNLGFVLYAQGRFEEAAETYAAVCESPAGQAETCGSLGDAYRQAGHAGEARRAYDKAVALAEPRLKVNPRDDVLRAALGWFLAGSHRCPEARREVSQAAGGSARDGTAFYYSAVAFALCGDSAQAVRATLRALDGGVLADVRTNPDLKAVRSDPAVARRLRGEAPSP